MTDRLYVTDWKLPGTCVNDATVGAVAWSNPSNALTDDGTYATAALTGFGSNSQYLKATNFGFAIPPGCRVEGVEIRVEAKESAGVCLDHSIILSIGGVVGAGSRPLQVEIPLTDTLRSYGSSSDNWGELLGADIVNASTFGVFYRVQKASGGAGTVSVDYMQMRVWYSKTGEQQDLALVKIRSPFAPHEELATILGSDLSFSKTLMRRSSASFKVSRTDPNLDLLSKIFDIGYAVSIERADGLHPWFGFITRINANQASPDVTFVAYDHAWVLERARTKKDGTFTGASGTLIASTFKEADQRGEPPLSLAFDALEDGPTLDYLYQMQTLYDFLTQISQFTGLEWGFEYDVSQESIVTTLIWTDLLGDDHQQKTVWEEGQQFKKASYVRNADAFFGSTVVVGGSSSFSTRKAASVNLTGRSIESNISAKALGQSRIPALAGTKILIDRQISKQEALFAAAQRLHQTPDYIGEQLSVVISEETTDMNWVVGDIITVRLESTFLGIPQEFPARIIGAQFDLDVGEVDVELQVLREV